MWSSITNHILSSMPVSDTKEAPNTDTPSSTSLTGSMDAQNTKKSLPFGSGVTCSSKIIEKPQLKSKKYMGARRSCAWIHIRANTGPSTKQSPARLSRVGVLKNFMLESKEAHQRHTKNTEELRLKCLHLENDLEFANRNLAQIVSTVQLLASQADRANGNVRELVRCFDTLVRDPSWFPDDSRHTPSSRHGSWHSYVCQILRAWSHW